MRTIDDINDASDIDASDYCLCSGVDAAGYRTIECSTYCPVKAINFLKAQLSAKTAIDEAKDRVVEAVTAYKQAMRDHAGDPCQCKGLCKGDCGPRNAGKVLIRLAELDALSKEAKP